MTAAWWTDSGVGLRLASASATVLFPRAPISSLCVCGREGRSSIRYTSILQESESMQHASAPLRLTAACMSNCSRLSCMARAPGSALSEEVVSRGSRASGQYVCMRLYEDKASCTHLPFCF